MSAVEKGLVPEGYIPEHQDRDAGRASAETSSSYSLRSSASDEKEEVLTVVWRDAHFDFDYDGTQRDDYLVTTVGFLVEDGDVFLSVAQERLPDDIGFRGVTHIPKVLVQRITHG